MSQLGSKPAASPRPPRAAAARSGPQHVNEKNNGLSSKPGEKKSTDEKKATSFGSSQPSRSHAGAAPGPRVSASSAATSRFSSMNSTEPKAVKTEPEKKSQSTKPSALHEKKAKETETKEHKEPEHAAVPADQRASSGKSASSSSEQPPPERSAKPKVKPQDARSSGRESVVAAVSASGRTDDKKKENKPSVLAVPVESTPAEPSGKSGMDAALDDLIDTLGGPEEVPEDNSTYTGPEVSDPMTSKYIEELGKREVTIPPKYRELLAKTEGVAGPPTDTAAPMGPDEAIDSLSSDFTCSPATGGQEEKPSGEALKAQSAKVIRSAAPPHEKKRKVEKEAMSDQALDALSASLGSRQPDPELDLSSLQEVAEAKAKEEKVKKCGEEDETVPSEYRLRAATDKDGKPLLPKPEEKSKPLSESELIDELSADFDSSKRKEEKPKPVEKTKEPQASAPTPVVETVPRASLCSIQAAPAKPAPTRARMSDEAVDALAGSLGEREADPEESQPAEDRVKEKAKEEDREKLGEKEETIPPDYRLEEVTDETGKPAQRSESRDPLPPVSEDFLLDALSKDFDGSATSAPLKLDEGKLSAVVSEVVSQSSASTTQAAGPPPDAPQQDNKALDDALDQLSDSLGKRQPDPDDDKPMEDKVKEKAKAEHRDKLGERDDTIPPEYRHLLDNDDKSKPAKPSPKKSPASKKPTNDQDAIDALSGDFDNCPTTAQTSENTAAKDKDKKPASHSKASKHGGKAKSSAKTKEETPKPKADDKNTS
ncbi:calpastatin isoform X3 [Sorex araneus]|uniref:calpastatin isoform X3 n=2 Tax=Sorex araneus TaxID=42254 RepID=UPI0024339EA4|nr:calpastatin isoform X3 [Sorex araneus]